MFTDFDECGNQTDSCSNLATCTNTIGAYTCSCNIGYIDDGFDCEGKLNSFLHHIIVLIVISNFVDFDECGNHTDSCSSVATCENTVGSYNCSCNIGYVGDGFECEGILPRIEFRSP